MPGRILVVDESLRVPGSVSAQLAREELELVHTADVEAALTSLRSSEPLAVLLEPRLLGEDDANDVLERVCDASQSARAGRPPIPVLVLTQGPRTPDLYSRALELGVAEFLSRPTAAQLLNAIQAALAADDGDADPEPEDDLHEKGTLGDLMLPELLRRLHRKGFTGVVLVSRERDRIGVELRNGTPVAVSSRGGRESLEDFLVRTERITPEQHDALTDQLFLGLGSPQECLLNMEVMEEKAIELAIRDHAETPLMGAFRWTAGSYRLLPGKRLKAATAVTLQRGMASLLFDGVLQHSPRRQVRAQLERRGSSYVAERAGAQVEVAVELSPTQRGSLASLQGTQTVSELLEAQAIDERLLYAFLLSDLVDLNLEPVLLLLEEVAVVVDGDGNPAEGDGAPDPLEERQAELSSLAAALAEQDDFAVLGIAEGASDDEARAAYESRLEALGVDGDLPDDARLAELTVQIRARVDVAWEHLKEAASRRAYASARREEAKAKAARDQAERDLQAEDWFRKGEKLLASKQYDGAVEAFGMASHLDAEQGEYVSHLGYALYLSRADDEVVMKEAMEQIARGIKLTPTRPMPYVFLGRMFKVQGDLENARKMFLRATKIDPDFHPALQELRVLEMRGQKGRGLFAKLRGK